MPALLILRFACLSHTIHPTSTPLTTHTREVAEIERGHNETTLNLKYKNRNPSLVQLNFANADALQGWWVAFSQIRDLSRRLVPSKDVSRGFASNLCLEYAPSQDLLK